MDNKFVVFQSKEIRRLLVDNVWFFAVVDVIAALTDSDKPRDYWYRMKQREKVSGIELSTICRQFKIEAPDGKLRETDCANTEGIFRIIQSIPSPKQSRSSAGWRRLATSGCRRSKTRNWQRPGRVNCTGQRGTRKPGLKNGCAASPYELS